MPHLIVLPDPAPITPALPARCDIPLARLPPLSSFDGTVRCSCCLPVMIRHPTVCDAEPSECFHKPRRSELRSVVCGQVTLAAGCPRQPCQHCLLDRCQRVFGSAAMREIPAHDLPRAAVDHAHQIRPAHCWPCPDFRHVRLPDLIRSSSFHAAPFFLASCSQTTRAHQQTTFAHHPQHTLAIHAKPFVPLQPPSHATIPPVQLLSARHDDLAGGAPFLISSV